MLLFIVNDKYAGKGFSYNIIEDKMKIFYCIVYENPEFHENYLKFMGDTAGKITTIKQDAEEDLMKLLKCHLTDTPPNYEIIELFFEILCNVGSHDAIDSFINESFESFLDFFKRNPEFEGQEDLMCKLFRYLTMSVRLEKENVVL